MEEYIDSWLIDRGFSKTNLNGRGKNGDTPLIVAAREVNIKILKRVIDFGVDVNICNNDNNNAIWAACFANSLESVELLFKSGCNINNQNVNGATALIYAASASKEELVELLIRLGAKTDLKTLDDFSALDSASTPKILKLLKNAR